MLRRIDNIADSQFVDFGAELNEIQPMRRYFADWADRISPAEPN